MNPRLMKSCLEYYVVGLLIVGCLASASAAPPIREPATPAAPVSGSISGCPKGAIPLAVGSDLQALVKAAPPDTDFCILAGEHRMQAITPKDGQRFYGAPGAILNGARLINRFSREGPFWVAAGQTQRGERRVDDECISTRPRCSYPDAFFIDNRPLLHVGSKTLVTPGKYFFDYSASKIYFADNPIGKKVEASVSPFAFRGSGNGVLVEGLIVEKYSSPLQYGAIGSSGPSLGWIVKNNEARLNYGLGISVGTKSHVLDNRIHSNGQMGAGCVGEDILFENNKIYLNGYFAGLDPFWEGGGAKCAKTKRLIVRANHMHHNNGFGFWTDIDNINTLYEGNLVESNLNGGLSHEISYDAVIRYNILLGNGTGPHSWLWAGAIQIQNSQNVQVYGNTIDMSAGGNGICLIQQDRGPGEYGDYVTVNNHVYRNVIISRPPGQGASGAIADHNSQQMIEGGNLFVDNIYFVNNLEGRHWAWVDGFYNWATYRQRSGQDSSSVITRSGSERDSIRRQ